jgi:5'-nucleotidase
MSDRAAERLTLVVTNDDGIDAPGVAALERAVRGLGRLVVVAPFGAYSGCGHVVTTNAPITVTRRDEDRYAVEGTPADCVRLAVARLAPRFDWVVSGINAGANLGADVYHSGTVAAVREGVLHGKLGVAVSQYMARGLTVDWERSAAWARAVVERLIERPVEPGVFWNVNLPHPPPGAAEPEAVVCPLDPSPLPLEFEFENDGMVAHYRGDYSSRARRPGSDVDVCFSGKIAMTPLRLEGLSREVW